MVPQHAHLMYVFSRVLVGQGELECPLNEGQVGFLYQVI